MKHLDLLLPFSLPPAELAKDLLRELRAPALAMLLARAAERRERGFDDFARALPHETWLGERFGLPPAAGGGSPALAAAAMRGFGLAPPPGYWFLLQPAHLHVARDHLILTDPRRLQLDEGEARAWFDSAQELFQEAGHSLLYGDAGHWFLRADGWRELSTASPDCANGRNIDIWLPRGPGEREWRRLHNELQMSWHLHPLKERREESGLQPVNALWLWGGSEVAAAPGAPTPALDRYAAGLAPLPDAASGSGRRLEIEDSLLEPALGGDWSAWLAAMARLENERCAPLLELLKRGKIGALSLVLTNGTRLAEFLVNRRSLARFWRQPTLSRLLP